MPPAHRILVTDEIDADGVAILQAEPSFEVVELPTQPREKLLEIIPEFDAFIGRSASKVPAELLRRAPRLKVVGRAGVGTDNIDIPTATELGVAVINAPAGNTIAVAELFFTAVLGLLRELPEAARSMREGRWDRSKFMGQELRGRTLGIVGLGRIGGEVAHRALAFAMDVVAYDPYVAEERFQSLRVRRATALEELVSEAEVLTVHTPLTDETRGLIGRRELARLPAGAIVVNMARGGIVDEAALSAALANKQVAGAVLDVYTKEPLPADSPLRTLANVVLTPHLGASTTEAQRNVAMDVCVAVRDALLSGELSKAINIAGTEGTIWEEERPAVSLARRAAAVARALLAERGTRAIQRLSLRYGPELATAAPMLLSAAAAGVLEGVTTDRLNLINARPLAEARGMELSASPSTSLGHPRAFQLSVSGGMQELAVAGVAAAGTVPRLTRIGGFHVDVAPRQTLLILTNNDVPGVIGHVGTCLGQAGVNIAEYHQARIEPGGEALAAISVDGDVSEETRASLLGIPDVRTATVVHFRDA
ncbi:MAG: phosphoglycerate dehydrogenase [Gemmatimonadaceae bacterium]